MDKANWHILQVASGNEVRIAKAIDTPCYVPRRLVTSYNRRYRVRTCRNVPAFPGFVFVQAPAPQTVKLPPFPEIFAFMRNGNKTFSVLQPKAFGDLLELEKEFLGQADRKLMVRGNTITMTEGDCAEVAEGPFRGQQAVVKEIRGDQILVELVEASLRISFRQEDLRVA